MLSRRLLRIKVAQAVYSHVQSDEKNLARTSKEFQHSARKCYELYLLMLKLLPELRGYANQRIEAGRSKMRPTAEELNPNMRFVQNPVFDVIEGSEDFRMSIGKLSWSESEVVRTIYNELLNSDFYKEYMAAEEVSFADHKKLIHNIYKKLVEDNPLVEAFVEDNSIFWIDDIGYALGIAWQSIKSVETPEQSIEIPEPFKGDHEEFAKELMEKAVLQYNENTKLIDTLTENWDVERIALMDRILIATAITELLNFPSIPVKATLDEYIEISKFYSTPQSATFINGILDKAVDKLNGEGRIHKMGRGLLEK